MPGWMCSGCWIRVGWPAAGVAGCWSCWVARRTMSGSRASAASLWLTQPMAAARPRVAQSARIGRITSLQPRTGSWWSKSRPLVAIAPRDDMMSQSEYEQHPTPGRVLRQIGKGRPALADIEGQVCRHVAGNEQTHIAADAGVDGDVLLAVGRGVGDGVADYA